MEDSLQLPLIQTVESSRPLLSRDGRRKWMYCSMACILITVCLERAAYYTLLGNLVIFLNIELLWSPDVATISVLAFYGLTWISCFIGGIFGDVVWGRFSTITVGLIFYAVGYVSLPLISFFTRSKRVDFDGVPGVLWLTLALLIISFGEGFFKANMAPFGADQASKNGDCNLRSFFSIFYWSINVGGFIGYGPMVYLLEHGGNGGFMYGYLVGLAVIVLAGLVFLMPKRYFSSDARPATNVLLSIWQVVSDALKNKKRRRNSPRAVASSYEDFVPHQHWLDRAMVKYGGRHLDLEVEEVKSFFRILPVFGFLLIYCALYYQMSGLFLLQGMNMNTNFGGKTQFSIPAAWLSLFNIVFVILFVPIVDRGIYPLLEKCHIKVSYKVRIAIGMIIASGAMVMAGFVEIWRLKTPGVVNITINSEVKTASNITILYQIPQYALVGISEIFVLITGLEFAYTNSPKSMQSIVTGVFFMANGIGSFIGLILLAIAGKLHFGFTSVKELRKKHVKLEGKLYYFFFFLAALNGVNWLCFIVYLISKRKQCSQRTQRQGNTVEQFLKDSYRKELRGQNSLDYPS